MNLKEALKNNKLSDFIKAQKIWAYYHFGICGGIKHPLTGKTYSEQYETRKKNKFFIGQKKFLK